LVFHFLLVQQELILIASCGVILNLVEGEVQVQLGGLVPRRGLDIVRPDTAAMLRRLTYIDIADGEHILDGL